MEIGHINLVLQRTGEKAKLVLHAKPFSHDMPITFNELEHFALYLAACVGDWRNERSEADAVSAHTKQL